MNTYLIIPLLGLLRGTELEVTKRSIEYVSDSDRTILSLISFVVIFPSYNFVPTLINPLGMSLVSASPGLGPGLVAALI